jgi:hypothetical protein
MTVISAPAYPNSAKAGVGNGRGELKGREGILAHQNSKKNQNLVPTISLPSEQTARLGERPSPTLKATADVE